jgi:hypothetical protein
VTDPAVAASLRTPLDTFPAGALRLDAVNAFMEAHSGDVLLGPCDCPLARGAAPPGWAFDCAAYDWRILAELSPWWGLNITHEFLDYTFSHNTANLPPTYHFSVRRGRVAVKTQGAVNAAFHPAFMAALRKIQNIVQLPDVEFVGHYWDHAKVPRGDAVPVFGWSREASRADVTTPFAMYWDRLGPGFDPVGVFDRTPCPPFAERREVLTWRGHCQGADHGTRGAPIMGHIRRARLTDMTRARPDILDAGITEDDCQTGFPNLAKLDFYLPADVCKHKYVLLIDGAGISGRSVALFSSGSLVFKHDSHLSENWYHLLVPWVHYIPVREHLEDLVEQVEWARAHPNASRCIARNANALARAHLNEATQACYWWRLLTAWARLQPAPPRSAGFNPI